MESKEEPQQSCKLNCNETDKRKSIMQKWIILGFSFVSVVLSYIFFQIDLYLSTPFAFLDLAWISIVFCGYPIFKQAFYSLKNKKITSSSLISIAILASVFMGIFNLINKDIIAHENYFFVAGEVAFLMALGEIIEDITAGKSKAAIKELIALKPTQATLKGENGYTKTDISKIKKDDIILVRQNETVPVDGVLISEQSSFNTASLTGEVLPKEVKKNQTVYASSLNLSQPVEIRVTKPSDESALSKLIDYYKKATEKKAPISRIADNLSSKLVPVAVLIALLVFAITAGSVDVKEGLGRGIAILVVFCPCALALATPTAIAATIGNASRRGILIKNGETLERLVKIDTIAFDKTGTLTTGEIQLSEVYTKNMTEDELLRYAASAEMQSEHPIAKAVIKGYGKKLSHPKNTEINSGFGIKATVEEKSVEIMKLSQAAEVYPEAKELSDTFKKAKTVVAIIIDSRFEGALSFSDSIKSNALESIKKLKDMEYKTILLTGDNNSIAEDVSNKLQIDEKYSNLLPLEKAETVKDIRINGGKRILMVGDGVNDAPAMSQSEVSIAMGAMGSEVAIEGADISLLNDDIGKIPGLMKLSRRGIFTIKINIAISLLINFITVGLSAAGILNAVWGAFFHNFSSVLVALNSALILIQKEK